jgi:hypothetical protein
MEPRWKLGITAAFAVLAVMAAWGWTRKPAPLASDRTGRVTDRNAPASSANEASPPPAPQEGYADRATEPAMSMPAADAYGQPASYGSALPSYATRTTVRTVRPRMMETRVVASQPVERERPVYRTQRRVYSVERRSVRHRRRSTKQSAAIVAGSAGVGAAIGALAGGGKGAAIGALAGGGGGFVYDRMTHDRR